MMKNNALARVLVVLLAMLFLIAGFQFMGVGQSINDLEAEPFDPTSLNDLTAQPDAVSIDVKEQSRMIEQVLAQPLFNASRTPYVAPIVSTEEPEAGKEVASPLDAKVTSIVIVGDTRYVMVEDKASKKRLTLTQGMPLEGEQGLWTVASIEPRKVRFEAEGMQPVDLELEVFTGSLGNPKRNNKKKRNAKNNKGNKNNNKNNKRQKAESLQKPQDKRKNSAEEIRKKIAERRAEMRKKAAGNKQTK